MAHFDAKTVFFTKIELFRPKSTIFIISPPITKPAIASLFPVIAQPILNTATSTRFPAQPEDFVLQLHVRGAQLLHLRVGAVLDRADHCQVNVFQVLIG